MSLCFPAKRCLIDFIRERGLEPPNLYLVDVGCSGGVYEAWRRWGNKLSGIGIDVLVDEVDRLQEIEQNPAMKYVASRICATTDQEPIARTTYALHRSQAYLATVALKRKNEPFRTLWDETVKSRGVPREANYSNVPDPKSDPFFAFYLERFGNVPNPRITSRMATLDEIVEESGSPQVDLLKIDTDGYDFDVLRSSAKTLQTTLAVEIEVQFQGPVGPSSNVFSNIDGLMRENGFSLYSLQTVNYSRSALPRKFLYGIPANTERGPIAWGDALYVRDALDRKLSDEQCRNLALILDIYNLEDAAAEIILSRPRLFEISDEAALDFLTQKVHGPDMTYADLTRHFLASPIEYPQSG